MASGPESEGVHEVFRHYRTAASIFSGTVIAVSSAILGLIWARSITVPLVAPFKIALYFVALIPLMFSIAFGVLVQYFIFSGYHKWANQLVGQGAKNPTPDFTRADKLTKWTLVLFLIGFVVVVVYLSKQYLQVAFNACESL